jgi:hypothetical protein
MTKIAGSGSISQRHGSANPDPDPHQNVVDPQHCYQASLASQDDLVAARRADLERELRSDLRFRFRFQLHI